MSTMLLRIATVATYGLGAYMLLGNVAKNCKALEKESPTGGQADIILEACTRVDRPVLAMATSASISAYLLNKAMKRRVGSASFNKYFTGAVISSLVCLGLQLYVAFGPKLMENPAAIKESLESD